jgi:hypothetical protein
MSDEAVNRFLRMDFESTAFAQTAGSPDIPYSWRFDMPLRYYTRTEGDVGGNTTVVLMGRQFYDDAGLGFAFESTLVNTLAATGFES